jgi:hypothetical protein
MEALKRTRVITANYRALQGLRQLPWLLWLLLVVITDTLTAVGPRSTQFFGYQCLFIVPGIAVPWALSRLIGTYYTRTFGQIERLSRDRLVEWLFSIVLMAGAYVAILVDAQQRFPVSLLGLVVAAILFVQWWTTGRFLWHTLLFAALFVGLALLPSFGLFADGDWFEPLSQLLLLVFIIVGFIGGVLNHVALVRNLEAAPQVE